MRRMGAGGVAAALIVGLAAAVAAAGDIDAKPAPRGILAGWFGDKAKDKEEKTMPAEEKPAPLNTPEMAGIEQQRQMNAYLRRVEVCLRLRQIAEQTGNADLQRQAEELDARAWEVYRRQTAHLSMPVPAMLSGTKTVEKRPTAKPKTGAGTNKVRAAELPAPKRSPQPLGGDFEQQEQGLLNGTFMGGNKP